MEMFRQSGIEAALGVLFPAGTAVAAMQIVEGQNEVLPAEECALKGAVPARRAEFGAGRAAARRALGALGHAAAPILPDQDRAPVWPEGVAGSIAHAAGVAVAVVREGLPIGVDVEEDAAIEPELWPIICAPDELNALPEEDRGRYVRRVFSAKEAAYKAQFPITRSVIGFPSLSIRLTEDGFTARFSHQVGPLLEGHVLHGKRAFANGRVLSGVAI